MPWYLASAGFLFEQPARIWQHYRRPTKVRDESISKVLEEWSATQRRLSNATASFLNESIDDSKDWKQSVTEIEPVKKRKRRFSADSANDLLFWGCHLAIVAISLGIMWVKFDGTNKALKDLLKAQSHEIDVVKSQALKAEQAAQEARNAEHTRNVQ